MINRRQLLQAAAAAAVLRGDSLAVEFRPEIEPLVRAIESLPRAKCVEWVAARIAAGTSYRQLLAALFLAGIRNVNPRPPGFALHCVFVIYSAHRLSLDAAAEDRMLPLVYALDQFKASQERDSKAQGGDWRMSAHPGPLPAPDKAGTELDRAMETWDVERAERAVVALARSSGAARVIEPLWVYGARDYRNIGHKAIFTANAWRTLQTIGWQHSEPVLRSLVTGLMDYGPETRNSGYAFDDQTFRENRARAAGALGKLPANWSQDASDPAGARETVAAIRQSTPRQACDWALAQLAKGILTAGDLWDGAYLAAAEMRMRAKGPGAFVAVHAVTSINGLRHAHVESAEPANRLLLTLQGVGWMGQFLHHIAEREKDLRPFDITTFEKEPSSLEAALEPIATDPDKAARRVAALASPEAYMARARKLIFNKAEEAHYYKYAGAIFEDLPLLHPAWHPAWLASSVYYLKGPADADSKLITEARRALGA